MKGRTTAYRVGWLTLAFLFSVGFLHSQPTRLFFQNYTTDAGLCHNTINSIVQDSRGFLWFGTAEGLSRFDGASFRNFFASRDSARSFPVNNISNLLEYKPDHLLFISGSQPWCLNTLSNRFYKPSLPFDSHHISRVEALPGNRLLLSAYDTIFIVNREFTLLQKIPFPAGADPFGTKAYYLQDDTLLLSDSRQFYLAQLTTGKTTPLVLSEHFAANQEITSFIAYDTNHHTFLLDNYWSGLLETDITGKVLQRHSTSNLPGTNLASDHVRALQFLNDSLLYLGTDLGLDLLNRHTGIVSHFPTEAGVRNSLVGNTILCFYRDRDGNTWVGTTAGISRITNTPGILRVVSLPFPQATALEMYKLSAGENDFLYASLFGAGTYSIHKKTGVFTAVDQQINYCWCNDYMKNRLYMAGGNGKALLMEYEPDTRKKSRLHFLDPYMGDADFVTLAFTDSRGDEWFSINHGGGLIRKPADGGPLQHFSNHQPRPFFQSGYYVNAAEDSRGNIWFSVNKSNLLLQWNRISQQFKEISMDTVPGLNRNVNGGVSYIWSGRSDTLWVSMESVGLIAYDVIQHRARQFTIEDGLPTNYISSIVTDQHKRVWMGTAKGLVCYLPAEKRFNTFRKENGLPLDVFTSTAIYFDQQDNELWLSSDNLILRINPDALLAQNKTAIPLCLDEVQVNGESQDFSSRHHFAYEENNFQFSFTAPDMINGTDLEFSCLLNGSDASWIYNGNKRSAVFSSLRPGSYTFLLRVRRKGDTAWTTIEHPYVFTIATPWWQTWWFYGLVALAALALVIVGVRSFFVRRLEKQQAAAEKQQAVEKERTRIATDMHDDFGASLSRIKFLSEKLQLQKNKSEGIKDELGKISAYSDEMAEKMGEIVWALNQRYDTSGDLVSFCRSYASGFLEHKQIRLHFESADTADINIKGEVRRNIFLVMKEALHNVVKHANATEVRIAITCTDALRVTIADNGAGFDPASVRPFANGLENMKKRIREIGGEISFENKGGTTIHILVHPTKYL